MSIEQELAALRATVEAKMESIDKCLDEHKGNFGKLFDRTDAILDQVRKINGRIARTETEVSVWRRVTYFVIFVVLTGGAASAVLALLGR